MRPSRVGEPSIWKKSRWTAALRWTGTSPQARATIPRAIAPDPFQLLAWWGANTSDIRLGTAVVNAAYWHPIKLAGEAAMADLISGGRLEFGIGSGAYQREFDRMHRHFCRLFWMRLHVRVTIRCNTTIRDLSHVEKPLHAAGTRK